MAHRFTCGEKKMWNQNMKSIFSVDESKTLLLVFFKFSKYLKILLIPFSSIIKVKSLIGAFKPLENGCFEAT